MQELPFLHSVRRLMLIDICMKFREESLRGFQVTERTRFVTDRQTDRRTEARGKTICLMFSYVHSLWPRSKKTLTLNTHIASLTQLVVCIYQLYGQF